MNFLHFICQDWHANKGNIKGRTFLLFFRAANICTTSRINFVLGLPFLLLYKGLIQWLFALEVPWNIRVGKNFSIYHGIALIINNRVVIGENCVLRHSTTLGVKQLADGSVSLAPVIGNYVDVGCNVCIIGDIKVGNHVKIGSGAVVVKNVGSNCIVVGNPAVEKRIY